MKKINGSNITPEYSDEKGMLDAKTIMKFLPRAIKAVCEIKLLEGFGSGFFCKIPYTENNNLLLPVLITANHVLTKEILNSKNDIEIIINEEPKVLPLEQRKIWNDENMDFTCIEIKEKEDSIDTFFSLDDHVKYKDLGNDCYLNENVIIFGINKDGKNVGFSNGIIKENEEYYFYYNCNAYKGCSGGCIVNQSNNCVIGIHTGKDENLNVGIYIRNVIERIKNKNISSNVKYNLTIFLVRKSLLFLLFYYWE